MPKFATAETIHPPEPEPTVEESRTKLLGPKKVEKKEKKLTVMQVFFSVILLSYS